MSAETLDTRPVRRIERRSNAVVDPDAWPYTLRPVAQLLRDGLTLHAGVTFLVGENGSGKSTLIEGVAAAAGLNAEGGSRHAQHVTTRSESSLHEALQLVRSAGSSRWSYFLRAETMHGLYSYLDSLDLTGVKVPPRKMHEMSHGESFLEILRMHVDTPGFYVMDEPESALSFSSCLALLGILGDLAARGAQVLCATHSPLLTALPGATILELDVDGYHPTAWEDLEIVAHWRRYLAHPQAYLRHLVPGLAP